MPVGLTWYCLQVAPQREFVAERLLCDNGFHAFCPTEIKLRRKNRYVKRKIERPYPLLIRYIFVGFENGSAIPWFNLFRLKMIQAVIGQEGHPLPIPADDMERVFFMSKAPQPYMTASNPHRAFRVGEDVEIIAGPFTDRIVKVEEVKCERARIILELLGRSHEVWVPLEFLEVA